MNRQCAQCKAFNPQEARFCHACGTSLDVDMGQKTVVLPPPSFQPAAPPEQITRIVQHAHGTSESMAKPAAERCTTPSQREQTVLCLDISDSMRQPYSGSSTKLEAAIKASIAMVLDKGQSDPLDEIALVTFRSRPKVVLGMSPISTCKMEIIEAIESLRPDNGTDINAGLKTSRDVFDWSRHEVVRRILLLTDGHGGEPLKTAQDLKSRGVVIDVIGVGANKDHTAVDEELLRQIASVINGEVHYQFITDQKTLTSTFLHLAGKTQTA